MFGLGAEQPGQSLGAPRRWAWTEAATMGFV